MKFFSVILLVCLIQLSQQANENYKIYLDVHDVQDFSVPQNPLATQCGGTGKLHDQRNTLCEPKTRPNCVGPNPTDDIIMQSYVSFTKPIDKLGWRNTITVEGKEPFVDFEGQIAEGIHNINHKVFKMNAVIKPTMEGLKGKATAKYEFFDMADKSVLVCIDAKFEFV